MKILLNVCVAQAHPSLKYHVVEIFVWNIQMWIVDSSVKSGFKCEYYIQVWIVDSSVKSRFKCEK